MGFGNFMYNGGNAGLNAALEQQKLQETRNLQNQLFAQQIQANARSAEDKASEQSDMSKVGSFLDALSKIGVGQNSQGFQDAAIAPAPNPGEASVPAHPPTPPGYQGMTAPGPAATTAPYNPPQAQQVPMAPPQGMPAMAPSPGQASVPAPQIQAPLPLPRYVTVQDGPGANANAAPPVAVTPGMMPPPVSQQQQIQEAVQQPDFVLRAVTALKKAGVPESEWYGVLNKAKPFMDAAQSQQLEHLKVIQEANRAANTAYENTLKQGRLELDTKAEERRVAAEGRAQTESTAKMERWKNQHQEQLAKIEKMGTGGRGTEFERMLSSSDLSEDQKSNLRNEYLSNRAGETTQRAKEKPFIEMGNKIAEIRTLLNTNSPESLKQVQASLASLSSHQRSTNLLYKESAAFGNVVDRMYAFGNRAITGGQYDEKTRNDIRKMLDDLEKYSVQPGQRAAQRPFVGGADAGPAKATPSGTQEGAKAKSKSGKPMIYRNGQWEYE